MLTDAPPVASDLSDEKDDDAFSFTLEMAAARCPKCETTAEPGPCPKCGTEVAATDEVSGAALARQKSLAPFVSEARALQQQFEHLPTAETPLSSDQFATCLVDAEVLPLSEKAIASCHRLAALDMNDHRVIGTDIRQVASGAIDDIRVLSQVACELARFAPQGPASELRDMGIDAGRVGVDVTATLIETVTAGTIEEARAANRSMQAALDSFNSGADDLYERLERYAEPNVDARIGLVLEKKGSYTDEFGFVEVGKVFGAFAGEGSLFGALAERSRAYFGHLVPPESLSEGAAVMLILPAVMLGSLDRPLIGHRAAAGMVALVDAALEHDPAQVREVVERSTNEGPRVFAAASRIYKGMRQMFLADQVEGIDEELAVREVLNAYQELSESSYKAYARTVIGLQAIVDGGAVLTSEKPSLGPLKQQLEASEGALAQAIGAAVDPKLRNATAHAQYRWDAEDHEIEDLETGQRWSREELQQRVDDLVGTVIGLDAGFCCKLVSEDVAFKTPDWVLTDKAPGLTKMLAETIFSASGYPGVEIEDGGATVVISGTDESDLTPLMTALGGFSAVIAEAEAYKVVDAESGMTLIDVPGGAMRAARDAPVEEKDLAILRAFCDSAARTGRNKQDAVHESLAVQAKVVCVCAMMDVVERGVHPAVFARMRARFEGVREFALSNGGSSDPELKKLIGRFERVVALTYQAINSQRKGLPQLARRLDAIISWAETRGVVWPPQAPVQQSSS